MNLAHWLERSAAVFGDRPALALGHEVAATYAQFAQSAACGAQWLSEQGLQPGDRVGLFLGNHPDYLRLLWSVWWAGLVAVPINARLHGSEAAFMLSDCAATLCFVDSSHADALAGFVPGACRVIDQHGFLDDRSLPPAPVAARSEDDDAWLFYTSGTTGKPKGVRLSARNLRWATMGYLAEVQPVAPGDSCLHPAPLSHGSGIYHLPYVLRGGVNVVPASGGFDGAEIAALAAHWRNASFFAAPTMVRRLVDWARRQPAPLAGLATVVYGGGPMYLADVLDAREVLGPHLAQIYGQGESPMTITVLPKHVIEDRAHPRWLERLASVGYAQPMVEIGIHADDGTPLAVGEPGEVCVRGEVVMKGYWENPHATAETIRDGWLRTGDIGRLDDDGFLTLLDRSRDLIISGGTNIYPREVEEALLRHPHVAEASVIGAPHAEWGETVVAWVVTSAPVSEAELDAHCLDTIARFKRPRRYRFIDSLPKNNYGKVLKTELREREAALAAAEGTTAAG
ncbi:MAG: AMP-binding protein [Burkholderiaceae bacterium]|nr:AMP-binding protein [Burkholderiaceae bacterium]